jgi:flagellar biosynthesis/type III secretory pathway protein FliH
MSLSRVVKKPSNVVFNEIVQIKDNQRIIDPIYETNISIDPNDLIIDAQTEASRILDEAKAKIAMMQREFDEKCQLTFDQIKQDAFNQGKEEALTLYKENASHQLNRICDALIELDKERNDQVKIQLDGLESKMMNMCLEITSKVLRQQVNLDSSILMPLILDELNQRQNQNIRKVEVSQKAVQLLEELRTELTKNQINLVGIDESIDTIRIEGDMGQYDLSIETQLRNLRRLFNTL